MTAESKTEGDWWSDDLLGRVSDAQFLFNLIVGRTHSRNEVGLSTAYVLNLNSGWGHGKTFFLERFEKDLRKVGHFVASVNAWQDDHAEDPLLAVVAALDVALDSEKGVSAKAKNIGRDLGAIAGQVAVAAGKGLLRSGAKKFLGEAVDEIGDIFSAQASADEALKVAEKLFDEETARLVGRFKASRKTIEKFRSRLVDFVQSLPKSPAFVLIDELDRCRPDFAVKLLERVKHLFGVDGLVFVIATDTEQLQHAVSAIYGGGFDSSRYLSRFFDSSYALESPSYRNFTVSLLEQYPLSNIEVPPGFGSAQEFIANGFDFAGLSLRDAEQCMGLMANFCDAWKQPCGIQLLALVPLAIAYTKKIPCVTIHDASLGIRDVKVRERRLLNWLCTLQTHPYHRQTERFDVFEIFSLLSNLATTPLHQLSATDDEDDPKTRWFIRSFISEFQLRFTGVFRPSVDGPYSLVRDYPAILRQAGKVQIQL